MVTEWRLEGGLPRAVIHTAVDADHGRRPRIDLDAMTGGSPEGWEGSPEIPGPAHAATANTTAIAVPGARRAGRALRASRHGGRPAVVRRLQARRRGARTATQH